MSMFCYQCEQTVGGTGCTKMGVCGKDEQTAKLQDLLVNSCKAVSWYAHRARQEGAFDSEVNKFVVKALFATVTNVNFDPGRLVGLLKEAGGIIEKARLMYLDVCKEKGKQPESLPEWLGFDADCDLSGFLEQAEKVSIAERKDKLGDDVCGLQELIVYGLKGSAAYTDHAMILGREDQGIYDFFYEALNFLTTEDAEDVDALVGMVMRCGEVNLRVMELLDQANTGAYGHPEPTEVRVTPVKGKCIVVSGHDLKDLHELLRQTEGKGINVYTHGEMLPCLAYPELKKFKHLVGNYGGAWQDQQREFDEFPGAVLMTTNCIQRPKPTYKDRIFTSGLVAWPGVKHIDDGDFSPVIEAALAAEGFAEDAPEKTITIGFARNAVMSVADKVIDAVKGGDIRHFFLIGGCDGAKPGRNYYTEIAEKVPDDCVILTLACGKYRFNKLEFGDIGGIPRLLDCGQCNDAHSAIQIAVALADAFDCEVNDLPLSLVLSWYEQKAVCILLSLLYLGIQDMRIGPSMPAFLGPNVTKTLVEKFGLKPIKTADEDLNEILEEQAA